MNKTNFLKRLDRFTLTESQREKYVNVYDRINAAHEVAVDELQQLRRKISFAGFFDDKLKLVLTDKDIIKKHLALGIMPCTDNQNLLETRRLDTVTPAPDLKPVGTITVYEPAEADERPCLTIMNVLAQIPRELSEQVSAFCLRLEDQFCINGYNLLAKAYEYHVELYAR